MPGSSKSRLPVDRSDDGVNALLFLVINVALKSDMTGTLLLLLFCTCSAADCLQFCDAARGEMPHIVTNTEPAGAYLWKVQPGGK